jgi:photosystem II stability/assembly factor-like uncharacterized protein
MSRHLKLLSFALCLAALAAAPAPAAVDPELLAGMKARSIGPAGMSGRVAAIAAVESNPDVVYAGAASGGVWKSTNGGLTWQPLFDDQPVASIGAVAIFQANPDLVWVGTGEGNPRNSASVGNGVYRSLDAGKTWTHVGLDGTERIHRIVLHPTDPDVAWAAALGREWGENPERGVFKTVDGGRSWQKVLYVDERTGAADLAIDPGNPNKLFASTWQFRRWPWFFRSGGPGSGLHVTVDGGRTWKKLTEDDGLPKGILGRTGLAVSPSHPNVVYAMVEAEKSALVRSDDGGKKWRTVNERYDVNPRPFYFAEIRVDPKTPETVYSLDYAVRWSRDGGKTFEDLVGWDIHGDHHALWIDPSGSGRFYMGNDGGVAVSDDGGKTSRFVANLPLAQFYHVAVDMATPYNVYGGLQDNSSWRGPNTVWNWGGIRNHEWRQVGWGDGFETLPDPFDANYVYSMWQGGNLGRHDLRTGATRDIKPPQPAEGKLRFNWNAGLAADPFTAGTIYYGSQHLHKSADRGESWTTISPDLTTDKAEWQHQERSGGLTSDVTAAENHTTIIAVAPSPLQQGVIWVGTDDGRLHVTRDGGATWTSLESHVRGVPANTWIPHIRPSRFDAASAFVVFDNHRRSDWTPYVYRTDDWGKTWKSLATKDLRGYALAIEQDAVDRDLLFLGTEFGLWVSLDGGAKWFRWEHGVPTVSVMDLALHPREHDLVIGTHGRALYVLDDVRPLRALSEATMAEPLHLYEIADAQQHWFAPDASGFGLGAGEFRGENRAYGAILTYSLNLPDLPHPDDEKERERKEGKRTEERKAMRWEPLPPGPPTEDQPGQPAAAEAAAGEEEKKKEEEEDKDKKKEDEKVQIRIADEAGEVVRVFKGPANRGVNRAAWDLGRQAARQLPSERPPEGDWGGPQVPPGAYQVTVRFRGHEAKGAVRVLADPRSPNTAADWQARERAIRRAEAIHEQLAEAIDRIRKARGDVDAVVAKVTKPEDPKALETPEPPPLAKAGGTLKEGLTKLEKKLWVPYDTPGIVPDNDVLSRLWRAGSYVTSSWEPPSPTHLGYLQQAEEAARQALDEVNRFFATEVAAFRKQAEEAGARLLPELPALTIDGAPATQ